MRRLISRLTSAAIAAVLICAPAAVAATGHHPAKVTKCTLTVQWEWGVSGRAVRDTCSTPILETAECFGIPVSSHVVARPRTWLTLRWPGWVRWPYRLVIQCSQLTDETLWFEPHHRQVLERVTDQRKLGRPGPGGGNGTYTVTFDR